MKYFSYQLDTKEYIGSGSAQIDPLESEKQGQNIYLLPANAVFAVPPEEKDGFARVWNGTVWEYAEDRRGTKYWLPGDTWQSEPHEMKELGPLPEGALLERPAKTPEELEQEELDKAKAERAEAVQNIAVEVDGMVFDGNEDAQRRISIALRTYDITGQQTVDWVLKNNTVANVTRAQLEQVLALSMQKMQEFWTLPYTE